MPTFYAAFGFLERYDVAHSEKPFFAPLVLLPLDHSLIEKKTPEGEKVVSIKASGEEPQYNLSLAKKLKDDDLELPEFDGDDTPEAICRKSKGLSETKIDGALDVSSHLAVFNLHGL